MLLSVWSAHKSADGLWLRWGEGGGGLLRNNKQRGWVGGGELQRRGWGLEMGGNSDFDASLVERLTASVTQQSCEATEQ